MSLKQHWLKRNLSRRVKFSPFLHGFVTIYFFIAFLLLPLLNDGQDLYPLTSWRLFAGEPRQVIHDITWDGGQTFLFRDYRIKSKAAELDLEVLFHVLMTRQWDQFKNHHLKEIEVVFGVYGKVKVLRIKGPLKNHFFRKESIVIGQVPL